MIVLQVVEWHETSAGLYLRQMNARQHERTQTGEIDQNPKH